MDGIGRNLTLKSRAYLEIRENPITRNLELTFPDKRGVGNQFCWNSARFFEYTGTNTFSRIQKGAIPRDGIRAKTRRFPIYQDLADSVNIIAIITAVRSERASG